MEFVRLLLIVLVLAPVVRAGPLPVCCESPDSCCPSGHDADCCERGLSFEVNRAWDHGLQPPGAEGPDPFDQGIATHADVVTATLPPLESLALRAWKARDGPRRPPPAHLATTILRL